LILTILNADDADATPMTADEIPPIQFLGVDHLSAAIGVASAFIGVMN
jgi:hypothetical protein